MRIITTKSINAKMITTPFRFLNLLMILAVSFLSTAWADVDTNGSVIVEPREVRIASEYKPHLGVLAGVSSAEGSYNSGAEYGFTYGYQPYIPFGLGLELSTANNNTSSAINSRDLQRTKLLVVMTYNLGGENSIFSTTYFGVAIGPMLESINNDDNLEIGTMPTLGFDYPIRIKNGKDISVGLNTRYLISSSSVPNAFSVNAMAKYWF